MERAGALLRTQTIQAGAQLRVETDPTLPEIPMDPTEMLQVVMNLGTNALRAESTEIVIRTEARVDHVALVVSDNGRGMTREESERAFDPFYTTRRAGGGIGLGLSLTHAIVARHGGRIEVRSEPGKGTTMIVVLPYLPRQLDA